MFSSEDIWLLPLIMDIISSSENRKFTMNNKNLNFIIPLITCNP